MTWTVRRVSEHVLLRGRAARPPGVVCVPGAGGAATVFDDLIAALPPDLAACAVHRNGGAPATPGASLSRVADQLARSLASVLTRPCIVLGHSLGGLLAFELALHPLTRRVVRGLVLCATPAPPTIGDLPRASTYDEEELVAYLETLGGIPAAVHARPMLLAMLLPMIRADLAALERHRVEARACPALPALALASDDDALAPAHSMSLWKKHLPSVAIRTLPGGHFFVETAATAVADNILEWRANWT